MTQGRFRRIRPRKARRLQNHFVRGVHSPQPQVLDVAGLGLVARGCLRILRAMLFVSLFNYRAKDILLAGYSSTLNLLNVLPIGPNGRPALYEFLHIGWRCKPLNTYFPGLDPPTPCQLLEVISCKAVNLCGLRKRDHLIFFRLARQRLIFLGPVIS